MSRIASILLSILIIAVLGAIIYVRSGPRVGEIYTDFYILGQKGKAADYPNELRVGEPNKIIVGITNHERKDMSYYVLVRAEQIVLAELGPVNLQNGQTYEKETEFILFRPGEGQKIEFLLFKEEGNEAYHSLYLWVDTIE